MPPKRKAEDEPTVEEEVAPEEEAAVLEEAPLAEEMAAAEEDLADEVVDYEAEPAADEAVSDVTAMAAAEAPAEAPADVLQAVEGEPGTETTDAPPADVAVAENGAAATDEPDPLSLPPHGSEVFVGGIPRTATEEQLKEFATPSGEVFEVVLLRDPANREQNRGYGFVKYMTREAANAAQETLHNQEMKDHPGSKLRVMPSQAKNKLYVGNIPKDLKHEQLEETLKGVVKGIESIDLLMSKEVAGQNRGFCFVDFYNNACAEAAKEVLGASTYRLGGRTLTVTYAEPKNNPSPAPGAVADIRSVYVGNLPPSATEAKLAALFEGLGEITRTTIPAPREGKPYCDFGFVHFTERGPAVVAVEAGGKGEYEMDGVKLNVKMGKPQAQQQQQQQRDSHGGGQDAGYGYGGGGGRGYGRGFPGQRGGFQQRGRGGPGRGPGRGYGGRGGGGGYSGGYSSYDDGYDNGDYGYDDGYGGGGYEGGGYGGGGGGYGGGGFGVPAAAAAAPAGMSMVPMMLPNGQVGYVLSSVGAAPAAAAFGAGGPMRSAAGRGYGAGGSGGGGSYGGGGGGYGAGARGRGRGGGGGGAYGGGRGDYGNRRYQPY